MRCRPGLPTRRGSHWCGVPFTVHADRPVQEMFSPPLFAALCSLNLEVAARRIATYKPLIGRMRTDITLDGTGLTVTYRPLP